MAWKSDARRLLEELNEFSTAASALTHLFEHFEEDPTRAVVLTQLLEWQALAQSSRAVGDLVAQFDALGGENSSPAAAADEEEDVALVYADTVLLAMGKPALLFATSIYDEELALLVWRGLVRFQQRHAPRFNLARQVLDNAFDSHGFCSLHYAIEAQMEAFIKRVAQDLAVWSDDADEKRAVVKQICRRIITQDVVLPMGKNQIQGKNIASGGCTLLHLAARKGELNIVTLLVASPFRFHTSDTDWDGNTPLRLAILHGHDAVAAFLQVQRIRNTHMRSDTFVLNAILLLL